MTCTEKDTEMCGGLPADRLGGLSPYTAPAQHPLVDLALDANEGTAPGEDLERVLTGISLDSLRRYPDTGDLERALAAKHGIDTGRIVVTNGADDAIDRVCRAVLQPGREVLLHQPTFVMIEQSAHLAGGEIRSVRWMEGQFPIQEYVNAITPKTSLVALVSPNNPTGGAIPLDNIVAVARAAHRAGALVLLDLAYVEFATQDPTAALLNEPNIVIVRTFSKALGLAGARVGYALTSQEIAQWLRTAGGPYPVSSVSAALATRAAERCEDRASYIDAVRSERETLTNMLRQLRCTVLESQANFVTARFKDAMFVQSSLASLGIGVRSFASRKQLDGFLRITLPGDPALFDRLVKSLLTTLDPEAILFDLDGVLADVSGSYRSAILQTASSFGVQITPDDINAAKHAGNANNDWELTRRLVEERGIPCKMADAIDRFQIAYKGTEDKPGLREAEQLIPDQAVIQNLAQRVTLGIVTGRPRAEAEWFLEKFGLRTAFTTLVCMEDAPAKPSPEPVRLALRQLRVNRAWMVGDTPDDIVAARTAQVLPIGVPAPGDSNKEAIDALRGAGAALVLDELSQIGARI